METKQQKLPVGIQTFEKIREDGCIYVDKTRFLIKLVDNGTVYFLSRPRRFGKSLTISTLDALFSGRKELFKGLYAEEFMNRPDYHASPVIRLDMSRITTNQGIESIEASLKLQTLEIAKKHGVTFSDKYPSSDSLELLIKAVAEKYGKVVILIDEYDKPYSDFYNNHEMAEKIREVLRNFYVRIKANDEYIRFVFITGISKFAKFGVFSGLNNPVDISLNEDYGEMCGITEEEIIRNFPEYLNITAKKIGISTPELLEKMRYYYDGFCFDGIHKLYNPFSTLCFFVEKDFRNFWMKSGTSKLIADYLKTKHLTVEQFHNFPVSRNFVDEPGDMDMTPPEGFLYQGGYLTIREGISDEFSLDYPNTEVLNSMSQLLTQNITDNQYNNYRSLLLLSLMGNHTDEFVSVVNSLLASIPYDDFVNAGKQNIMVNNYAFQAQEWLYRSTILAFMRGCGVVAVAEMHTNLGRADMVITHKGNTWIIELKVACKPEDVPTKLTEAITQMTENNYAAPYPNATSLALVIDDTKRQITASEILK
jgi:hypothetical protein